jgi:RNA polymerase sigma factor (sigma-70 family)
VPSDIDLLEAWRAGDRDAGDALLTRYFEPICRFFRSKLGADSDDLVQRTFVDCVEARDRVGEDGFRAYLYGIARNRLRDHFRAGARRGVEVDLGELSIADLATSPRSAVARDEEQRILVAALQTLPVDDQIALELTYWEGLSNREVADVLGAAESSVRSRLSRARERLRAAIREVSEAADETMRRFCGDREV